MAEEMNDYIVIHEVDDVLTFVGSFVIDAVEEIDTDEMELVIKSTATCSSEVIASFCKNYDFTWLIEWYRLFYLINLWNFLVKSLHT